MTGPRIPGFTYLQHLGSGGFADVYLYEQEWPQQKVAVKVVRPDVALTEREKSLFTAEANAMARLADHPYIVSVITAGVTEDRPYLVMRYCPPPDLGVRVRSAPMSTADAISTGIKIASAVETAHRVGIVHRDIKPSNVLVTTYQEPALTDFGIAGHLHEVEGDDEVRISYPWSPPELLEGRSNGSVASDVYSLGATIWNLLTGRSPFAVPHGDNSAQALTARILHTPASPTQRRDVPPGLERLLAQCLAKDPRHRPRSALELARGLQRVEAEAGFSRTAIAVEGDRPATSAYADPELGAGRRPGRHERQADHRDPRLRPARGAGRGRARRAGPGAAARPAGRATVVGGLGGARRRRGRRRGGAAGAALRWQRRHRPAARPVVEHPALAGARRPARAARASTASAPGDSVTFTWRVPGGTEPEDTWEWTRPDTGERDRTTDTELTVRAPGRVCLQVTLVRGSEASPVANRCID